MEKGKVHNISVRYVKSRFAKHRKSPLQNTIVHTAIKRYIVGKEELLSRFTSAVMINAQNMSKTIIS